MIINKNVLDYKEKVKMTQKYYVYLWHKSRNDWDDNFVIKPMPNENYNPQENVKNVARLLMDCSPGNTLDGLIGAIADRIRMLMQNSMICEGDFLSNPHWLESQIRCALIDVYQENQP